MEASGWRCWWAERRPLSSCFRWRFQGCVAAFWPAGRAGRSVASAHCTGSRDRTHPHWSPCWNPRSSVRWQRRCLMTPTSRTDLDIASWTPLCHVLLQLFLGLLPPLLFCRLPLEMLLQSSWRPGRAEIAMRLYPIWRLGLQTRQKLRPPPVWYPARFQ